MTDEWVTATQAVGLLNVSERSVRRFVRHLPDTDRRKRQGHPLEFRLSALTVLMGRGETQEEMSGDDRQAPEDAGQVPDTQKEAPPDTNRQAPDTESALVEQLRQENAFLRSALEKEQANSAAALALARESEQRAAQALLIAGRATGQIASAGHSGGDSAASESAGGGIVPPGTVEEPRRGIRAWLRRVW